MVMRSEAMTASITLGVISVIVWMIAEIPQLITNYREKSAHGLSVTFLLTWIIGDLFNVFGCLLEPATLPTQLYTAVLYTMITLTLCSQAIYYGHIYPRLNYKRQFKIDTSIDNGQSNNGVENCNDADRRTIIGLSSPIPFPAHDQNNHAGTQSYYQSARYLSKSYTPKTELSQRITSSFQSMDPIEEPLLVSSILTKSAPSLKIKTTLCLVSTFTLLGALNLLQSPDTRIHSEVLKPRKEFVIYVGRKLLQVSGNHLQYHGVKGQTSFGVYLGWAMAVIYMSGRLPQICLNIKRGNFEGVNPLMFLFALVGNTTYVASILVRSLDWSRIGPNLPWLVESGGCSLLDSFAVRMSGIHECSRDPPRSHASGPTRHSYR
ncbi:PQ-loop repeat family protein / transmembrane family protein [Trifolium repens]|nr:PQ-loop repeat family protein / transmembrane family protein [Trifolium repens]